MCKYELNSIIELWKGIYMISYKKQISHTMSEQHNINVMDLLNLEKNFDFEKGSGFDDVSISLSAAITGYARIYMAEVKLYILSKGGQIYYSDTDSIVTDIELSSDLIGDGLGQFKLEAKVNEGFFITNKTYCLVLHDGYKTKKNKGIVIKAKGVNEKSLSLKDFEDMYYNHKSAEAIKINNERSLSEGYVNIDTKTMNLKYDSYTKRTKIYDSLDLWVDT